MRVIKQSVGVLASTAWLLVGLCLLFAGAPVIAAPSGEEALRARVEQCYSALQQGDWPKAEKCFSKDSKPIFRRQTKNPLMAYKIQSIKMGPDGQTATVVVQVPLMSAAIPKPIPVPITTLWRLTGRVWYIELSRPQPGANAQQSLFDMAPKGPRPPVPSVNSKDLKFESYWCGLGNVQSGETPVAKFPFTNVSTHSVTLAEVQLGCDCLHLKTQQKEYKSGESGTLEIEFDPSRLGLSMEESFSQGVVLKTEPGGGYVLLTIAARVAPAPNPPAKP